MTETKFEVGDIVEWGGVTGTVIQIVDYGDYTYPVVTTFPHERLASFTSDGKYYSWHKEPSLKLVSKAKKKMIVECWVNVYRRKNGSISQIAHSEEDIAIADRDYGTHKEYLTTVHLSKEIEI